MLQHPLLLKLACLLTMIVLVVGLTAVHRAWVLLAWHHWYCVVGCVVTNISRHSCPISDSARVNRGRLD